MHSKASPNATGTASSLYTDSQAAVRAYVAGGSIDAAAAAAFGADISGEAVAAAVRAFDRYGWARLELVDEELLHGARGAYDRENDTIYMSRQFLAISRDAPAAVTAVLIEEIGHAIDAHVQAVDAPGDEGAIFAQFVLGDVPDATALAALHAENDHTTIVVDGVATAVELAGPVVGTITLDGALTDWSAGNPIDKPDSTSTTGYNIYGQATGGSFVFALQAPVAIGANTTVWFNTDQNTATGFRIFGSTGGAEFNINFDATGTPHLYTGNAGATPVPGATVSFGYSADKRIVEFAVPKTSIGSPKMVGTLWDVNDATFLPGDYAGAQYDVLDPSSMPQRTDFSKKIGILYSDTSANKYFDKMAYSQLFMAAQNQASIAGVHYDILTEADLTNLAKLANYDALLFPSFTYVQSSQVAAIESTLQLAVQNYHIGLIASGDFMTSNETGGALAGDAYARMKALFDLQLVGGGFPASVTVNAADVSHPMMVDYSANEQIRSYTGAGWLAYTPVTTAGTSVLATQTVNGQTFNAVVATTTGGRNVHFSSDAVMADNNLLWQAVDYAVNGVGISAGLQLSRQAAIVASRTDMDQAMAPAAVSPAAGDPGIYDKLLPILQQWKTQYDFVGSYYVDIGDQPPNQQTDWAKSGAYYKQILAMGNELGSHSISHPFTTNSLTPAQIQYQFESSKQVIERQMSTILGQPFTVQGAAVPGAPENLATALNILQYYDYMSGGYSSIGAGYPGAAGYLNPTMAGLDKVYLAPNIEFDFSLVEYQHMTPAQASAEWAREWSNLASHTDVPVIVWPWHDYSATEWRDDPQTPSPYTTAMFTQFISQAYAAGAEFVTLTDLADRISFFNHSSVTTSVSGNTVTATITSPDAGKFALDLDNLAGSQKIASVNGWYAYDNDSVFLDRDGGTFTITLGTAATDVTHITSLPMRTELVSLSGNGTDLTFSIIGEGTVVIDLSQPGNQPIVAGAKVLGLAGGKLSVDLGAFGLHNVAITFGSAIESFDANGDGKDDILWRHKGGVVVDWLMDGTQTNGRGSLGLVPTSYRIIDALGDYNGDGKSDILWRNVDGAITTWLMDGTQSLARASIPGAPATYSIIDGHGDYNGDGKSDILWRNDNGLLVVWFMDGTQSTTRSTLGIVPNSYSIVNAHGDYNGDGKSDILWRNSDGTVTTWLMDGGQTLARASLSVPTSYSIVDATGDYNGDGKSDILWRNSDGTVTTWLMDGGQTIARGSFGAVPTSYSIIGATGDYNGDGKSDILWRHTSGTIATWLMDGTQTLARGDFGLVPTSYMSVDSHSDFNGDGKSDILWRVTDTSVVTWLMDGTQTLARNSLGTVPFDYSVITALGSAINGGAGNDVLTGTDAGDAFYAAGGNDNLTGGAGADRFVMNTALSAASNVDRISDFTPGADTLVLDDVIFRNLQSGPLAATNFVSGPGAAAHDSNDFILYNTSNGGVSYDADGAGPQVATLFAMLENLAALTADNVYVGVI